MKKNFRDRGIVYVKIPISNGEPGYFAMKKFLEVFDDFCDNQKK